MFGAGVPERDDVAEVKDADEVEDGPNVYDWEILDLEKNEEAAASMMV